MTRFELFRRNLWLALQRAPRDTRARRVLGACLFFVGYVAYLITIWVKQGTWFIATDAGLLLLGFGVAFLIRRSNDKGEDSLLKLSAHPVPLGEEPDLAHHRGYLADELLRISALVDRSGGEALHLIGNVREEYRGTCRRRTLDVAQQDRLWPGFTVEERELLLSQEGSWDQQKTWAGVLRAEDVRVLRWVLRLDQCLTPFEFLEQDLKPAVELTSKPKLVEGDGCIPPSDLRPARIGAQQMVVRCFGEGIRRGLYTPGDETHSLADLAERMSREPSEDLIIGSKTVGEAEDKSVQRLLNYAVRRMKVLDSVIAFLQGPAGFFRVEAGETSLQVGGSLPLANRLQGQTPAL